MLQKILRTVPDILSSSSENAQDRVKAVAPVASTSRLPEPEPSIAMVSGTDGEKTMHVDASFEYYLAEGNTWDVLEQHLYKTVAALRNHFRLPISLPIMPKSAECRDMSDIALQSGIH